MTAPAAFVAPPKVTTYSTMLRSIPELSGRSMRMTVRPSRRRMNSGVTITRAAGTSLPAWDLMIRLFSKDLAGRRDFGIADADFLKKSHQRGKALRSAYKYRPPVVLGATKTNRIHCSLGPDLRTFPATDMAGDQPGRLTVRDAVVRTRTRYISLIRALLRQQGYRVPSGRAEAFVQRVSAVRLPGRLFSTIAPLLAITRHLNAQLAYSDEAIDEGVKSRPAIWSVTSRLVSSGMDLSLERSPASPWATRIRSFAHTRAAAMVEFTSP